MYSVWESFMGRRGLKVPPLLLKYPLSIRFGLTSPIYENCRRQNLPQNRKSKTDNFFKRGFWEVFEIGGFGFLLISTCGKETKTSKMKNRWKTDVLEILEVLVFAFLVAFGRRHFSYMCAVRGIKQEGFRSEPHSKQLFRQDGTRAADPYSFSTGPRVNGGRDKEIRRDRGRGPSKPP